MGGPAGSVWDGNPDADWAVYILSWMFSICAGAEHPLFYGNLIVFLVDILLLSGIFRWKKKKQQKMFVISERMISRKWILKKELLLFGILTVFVTWMMFYVFHMKTAFCTPAFRYTEIMHPTRQ